MLLTILLFIVILGLCIFVHEIGHFFAAKKTGMRVEEFGFGFPPRIIGIQKDDNKKWRLVKRNKKDHPDEDPAGGTIYSINWIPVGGFVKIKGEQGDMQGDHDSFTQKKIWKRAVTLSAGVAMNFVLAFFIITIGFNIGLPSVIDEPLSLQATIVERNLQILEVQEESPAAKAELQMGDFITAVDENEFIATDDFQAYTQPKIGQEITLSIKRGNEEKQATIIPEDLYDDGKGKIGVWLVETGVVKYPWYYAIWMGAKTTVSITWQILVAFYEIIKNLIITQQAGVDIAGPVGIAVLTGQVAKLGFIYILQFTALLSINLAIINFIPFPALDGGRVLFLIIEKIKGKPINRRVENAIHTIGFFVLMGLILFVTFKDVSRFSESIKGFFTNLF